jgi:hypothetical protein
MARPKMKALQGLLHAYCLGILFLQGVKSNDHFLLFI